ncbi:universal stress protein [Kitasatospora sp. NPDC054939]
MNGPIVAGFDGSPESTAAAGWAAREALLRKLPLELVQAWPWPDTDVLGTDEAVAWSREQLAAAETDLRRVLAAGGDVMSAHVRDSPVEALVAASGTASMLVLGSRGLGTLQGFLVGSVSQEVLRRAACPTILVRAGSEPDTGGAVVLGLDLRHACDEVIGFAFEAARLRGVPLRVVHVWAPPAGSEYMAFAAIGSMDAELSAVEQRQLADTLGPWRSRHPEVAVTAETVRGHATVVLVEEAAAAGLVVVGRRTRRAPVGTHLGPVTHAAIHHVRCPVAVVPYG